MAILSRLAAAGTALLQLGGLAAIAAGAWAIFPPAGLIAAGLALFATGLVLDLPRRLPARRR
jgi:hypothetical protein